MRNKREKKVVECENRQSSRQSQHISRIFTDQGLNMINVKLLSIIFGNSFLACPRFPLFFAFQFENGWFICNMKIHFSESKYVVMVT